MFVRLGVFMRKILKRQKKRLGMQESGKQKSLQNSENDIKGHQSIPNRICNYFKNWPERTKEE